MQKILVIDDESSMRTDILKVLQYEGFEGIGAENGQIGIQLAREHQPDLIVCDIIMPGMNGYKVLSELRQNQDTALIPFIFLSANRNVRKGMNLGADDYLCKPFQIEDLLTVIHTRLEKAEHARQQRTEESDDLRSILPQDLLAALTNITAFSEFLMSAETPPDGDEVRNIGTIIHESSLHLQHLVENYLLYARLQTMETDPDEKAQWLSEELLDVKEYLTFLAQQQAECVQRTDDVILELVEAHVRLPRKSLQEILVQLLDNAFTFSDPGTPVRIETSLAPSHLTIKVQDSGQGMTDAELHRIGTLNELSSRVWDDDQSNSRFGLCICLFLARLHGATLTIKSKPKKGTLITVEFKLKKVCA